MKQKRAAQNRSQLTVVPRQAAANLLRHASHRHPMNVYEQGVIDDDSAMVARDLQYQKELVHATRAEYGQEAEVPLEGSEPKLVHQPGGDIVNGIVHPSVMIVDRLYRKLPQEGFYSPLLNPRSPFQFEIGSIEVPDGLDFWIFDYEFSVYRLSGQDPGDALKCEDGRFSGFMGFDLVFDEARLTDLSYELDPSPIGISRDAFGTILQPTQDDFNSAASRSFAANASSGLSTLPFQSEVMGARNAPFSLVANQTSRVALNCIIWRTVTTPLAWVQAKIGGFFVQNQLSSTLINRMRPR